MVIDRLIPRKAFHLPEIPDSTSEVIQFLRQGAIESLPSLWWILREETLIWQQEGQG